MKLLTSLLRLVAAIASGLGIAALFPPYSVGKLVWVVLIPLLIALWTLGEKWKRWKSFGLGYIAGACFFLPNLAWLRSVSDVGWVALSLYLAVFPALWALFVATLGNPWQRKQEQGFFHAPFYAFACAGMWALLEIARGWIFTGFGWNVLGVAFHETPVFAQSADLLGATGLSMLPIFAQAVLVQVCVRRSVQYHSAVQRRQIALGSVVLLMGAAYVYGSWRIKTLTQGEFVKLRALLVQLNIPQEAAQQLWSATDIHLGYEEETLLALQGLQVKKPDWILWPETALTGRVLRLDDGTWAMGMENVQTIDTIRAEGPYTLIMGLNELEGEKGEGDVLMMKRDARIWNTMTVMPPDGSLTTFRKHHLVIFGEYIPLVESLPFLAKIYEQQAGVAYGGAFSAGESLDPVPVDVNGESVGVIPTVCFEDSVPRLVRKFVRGGPQIIVNVTNDGWFKETPGAEQHFANARFRAIEIRRPMIRCANTGVSAAVNAVGTTLRDGKYQELRDEKGSTFTRGSMLVDVDIPKNPPLTLYARIGDLGVIALGILAFLLAWWKATASNQTFAESEG